VPKVSTVQNKKLFFFYNREMTRRNLPSSSYADIPERPGSDGDFQLSSALHQHAVCAAVQERHRVPAGHESSATARVTSPAARRSRERRSSIAVAAAERQSVLKIYTASRGFASLPAAPNPGVRPLFLQQSRQLVKKSGPAAHRLRGKQQGEYVFRWVNDYQKETIQTGIWTGEPFPIQPQTRPKPGSSWSWNVVTKRSRPLCVGNDSVVQPPVSVAVHRRRQSAEPQYHVAQTGLSFIRRPTSPIPSRT